MRKVPHLVFTVLAMLLTVALVGPPTAQAAQSRPNCALADVRLCYKSVDRVSSLSVRAPAAVAGVPPTLTASFNERIAYPKTGAASVPFSNKVYIDMRSFGGVNGVPAHLCSASRTNTTVGIEHTYDFAAGPLSFNGSIGPVSLGFVAGPRTLKIVTGDRQGCNSYYNAAAEVTIPPGLTGVTHTMTVTSKIAGGATTTSGQRAAGTSRPAQTAP